MLRVLSALSACLLAFAASATTRVTILHFSDYHSHAVPFYSEGKADQGGIARAISLFKAERKKGALIFSGGDMINRGSPAWSDKYTCAEWPWLNGLVDAMAFGNHEPDYGAEELERCRKALTYPILSANTEGFMKSAVIKSRGIRVGVFAVAGADFGILTSGFRYTDRVAAAKEAVRELREKADVVILIGHESAEEDFELARAVPGIDLILGSHSHRKEELRKIEGTNTWFISPFQYLAFVSRVELIFDGRKLSRVEGRLVPLDNSIPFDRVTAERVSQMQSDLERDPKYAHLFERVGNLPNAMEVNELAARTVDLMREVAGAEIGLSSASTFRHALPKGYVTFEELRAALPYDNEIVVAEVSGEELERLMKFSDARRGTDIYAYGAGLPSSIVRDRTYVIATTDYFAGASPYREFFTRGVKKTGVRVRAEVRKWLGTLGAPAPAAPH